MIHLSVGPLSISSHWGLPRNSSRKGGEVPPKLTGPPLLEKCSLSVQWLQVQPHALVTYYKYLFSWPFLLVLPRCTLSKNSVPVFQLGLWLCETVVSSTNSQLWDCWIHRTSLNVPPSVLAFVPCLSICCLFYYHSPSVCTVFQMF